MGRDSRKQILPEYKAKKKKKKLLKQLMTALKFKKQIETHKEILTARKEIIQIFVTSCLKIISDMTARYTEAKN